MSEQAMDRFGGAEEAAAGAAAEATVDGLTLPFWVSVTQDDVAAAEQSADTMGLFSGDGEAVLRAVPLGPLRKNLGDTIDALQRVFQEVADKGGALPLAEAQLSFQVTASGGVQLIGTGQIQGTRGLTLTFKRPV